MLTKVDTSYIDTINLDDVPTIIKIGGDKIDRFEPIIKMSKWDNEAWLTMRHPDVDLMTTQKEIFEDGKIDLYVGNNIHRFYEKNNSELSYEQILLSRPPGDIIEELELEFSEGVSFHYQDTLENEYNENPLWYKTLEDFLKVVRRPDHIVGSYVVKFNKKHNQYKTGKFAHIYRPLIIDAHGTERWGQLVIVGKRLIKTCDFDGLVFPVTIDPDIGYTSIGGSNSSDNDFLFGTLYSCTETGSANPGTFYVYGEDEGDNRVRGAVYDDNSGDPNNKLSSSEAEIILPNSLGWYSGAITCNFTNGVDYWICCHTSDTRQYYDATDNLKYRALDYDLGLPDPFGSPSNITREYSMYINYTGSGGSIIPVMSHHYSKNIGSK